MALYQRSNPGEEELRYRAVDFMEGLRIVDEWLKHA